MVKNRLLNLISLFIIFFAVIHIISLYFYLYLDFWWLDILMHFGGGFWVVLFFLWLIVFSFAFIPQEKVKFSQFLFLGILLNLFISLLWEVFELKFDITFVSVNDYWQDTVSDFLAALAGGLSAILYFSRQVITNSNEHKQEY